MDTPYPLASRKRHPSDLVVPVGGLCLGGPGLVVIAGPCAVEGEAAFLRAARALKAAGAHMLRGGAFKPRTSPYSFQGLGRAGLRILAAARRETGLPVVSEVIDPREVDAVARVADVLQVGARNMQNYPLLRELGRAGKPVLLKRGLSATIEEWLLSAEHVLASGNGQVILCERGQRLIGEPERCGLDAGAIPLARRLCRLPVFVDPSHAARSRDLVAPLARAAAAAGAQGLMIEVHERPSAALSDGRQALSLLQFRGLMAELSRLMSALGTGLAQPQI